MLVQIVLIDTNKDDPDIDIGGILTLERADGRSVWRNRIAVIAKTDKYYLLSSVDELGKPIP